MSDVAALRARLQSWQEHGLAETAQMPILHLQALLARVDAAQGRAQEALLGKLQQYFLLYAAELDEAVVGKPQGQSAEADSTTEFTAEFADGVADGVTAGVTATPMTALLAELAERQHGCSYPELPLLEPLRELCSQLRSEDQLRQSLLEVPEDAGPLNSGKLVHRALNLMRGVSPGYLQHFVGYLDHLAWLEKFDQALAPPPRPKRRKKSS